MKKWILEAAIFLGVWIFVVWLAKLVGAGVLLAGGLGGIAGARARDLYNFHS